jgi:arginase
MKRNPLDLYRKCPTKEAVSFIGIPFEDGSDAIGLRGNPQYLRKCGLVSSLEQSGIKVLDCGDILVKETKSKDKKVLKQLAIDVAEAVSKKVADEIKSGRRVLALGGDHSISLGTISGASIAKGKDIGVIWIDAHPDISTWEESLTKNVHGMLVSSLLGVGDKGLVNILEDGAKIKKQNVLYIGLKDMDDYEINYLKKKILN